MEKIRHATIKMTDYYPLIARAVEELGRSTGEARQSLYERARNAVAQLRSNPALLEADIAKECLALEEAIRKVEAETAGKSRTETRTEPQSAAPTEGTPDDSAQVASKSPRRHRADPPPAAPLGAGGSAVLLTAREQLLSGRSSRKRKAVKGSRDIVRDVPDLGATTAKSTQPARHVRHPYEPEAPQYPPAKEYLDTHDLKRKAVKGSRDVVRDAPDLGAPDTHDYSGDYATRQERDLERLRIGRRTASGGAAGATCAPQRGTGRGVRTEGSRPDDTSSGADHLRGGGGGDILATVRDYGVLPLYWIEAAKPGRPRNVVSATQILGAGSAGARQGTSVRPGGGGQPNRTRRGTARRALRGGPE